MDEDFALLISEYVPPVQPQYFVDPSTSLKISIFFPSKKIIIFFKSQQNQINIYGSWL